MKNYGIVVILAVALVLICAGMCSAVLPVPDGYASFKMQQGWYNGQVAWYIAAGTGNIRWAADQNVTFAPLLQSAIGEAADMLIVTNPMNSQGPIFATAPGDKDYSGVWQVFYIQWNPGFTVVPITSILQAEALVTGGQITAAPANIVVDDPIVAIGGLGGPWLPQPAGAYRIKQGTVMSNYLSTKVIWLPEYKLDCEYELPSELMVPRNAIVPDASSASIANLIGANLAPGLLEIDQGDTQPLWWILGATTPGQLPLIGHCPRGVPNMDPAYTPIMRIIALNRDIPESTTVNSVDLVELLIGNGGLTIADDTHRINAPVLPTGDLIVVVP